MKGVKLSLRKCDMCNKTSQTEGSSLACFGDWMIKNNIVVHYYCLLLATHLPQRGADHNGILGFLMRDIRQEISNAKQRKCIYCFEMSASIQCVKCKQYFHLTCGHTSKCRTQFVGEFKSYCHKCVPIDRYQMQLFARNPPKNTELCFICVTPLGSNFKSWIYAKCCGSGYTHAKCMKIYALSAGYYLCCIWCKAKRFREDIKYLGIFVPDRDANWEREKGAYGDLYRRHKRCDMEICNCPKGRHYTKGTKWQLVICKLCGASGAHSPGCTPGLEFVKDKPIEYKCDVCSVIEQTLLHKSAAVPMQGLIDTTLYVQKAEPSDTAVALSPSQSRQSNSFSIAMVSSPAVYSSKPDNASGNRISSKIYTLTQSPQTSQQNNESSLKVLQDRIFDNAPAVLTASPSQSSKSNNCVDTVSSQNVVGSPPVISPSKPDNSLENTKLSAEICTLTQSPQTFLQNEDPYPKASQEENSDSDGDVIVDLLVQEMLNILEHCSLYRAYGVK